MFEENDLSCYKKSIGLMSCFFVVYVMKWCDNVKWVMEYIIGS